MDTVYSKHHLTAGIFVGIFRSGLRKVINFHVGKGAFCLVLNQKQLKRTSHVTPKSLICKNVQNDNFFFLEGKNI